MSNINGITNIRGIKTESGLASYSESYIYSLNISYRYIYYMGPSRQTTPGYHILKSQTSPYPLLTNNYHNSFYINNKSKSLIECPIKAIILVLRGVSHNSATPVALNLDPTQRASNG